MKKDIIIIKFNNNEVGELPLADYQTIIFNIKKLEDSHRGFFNRADYLKELTLKIYGRKLSSYNPPVNI